MDDRIVTVSHAQATDAALAMTGKDRWVNVTGKDYATGELVTFRLGMSAFFDFYDGAQHRPSTDVRVGRERVISVASDPEWDSPGTSPEDGS